jgi:hypothetical protein
MKNSDSKGLVFKNEDGKLCNYMYGEFKTHFGMEHCNTKIPSSI